MEVVGLWHYPVKSLQGESIDAARVEADGVLGDRRWGIRDQRTGRILTARRRPELLGASAFYDGDEPVIDRQPDEAPPEDELTRDKKRRLQERNRQAHEDNVEHSDEFERQEFPPPPPPPPPSEPPVPQW